MFIIPAVNAIAASVGAAGGPYAYGYYGHPKGYVAPAKGKLKSIYFPKKPSVFNKGTKVQRYKGTKVQR